MRFIVGTGGRITNSFLHKHSQNLQLPPGQESKDWQRNKNMQQGTKSVLCMQNRSAVRKMLSVIARGTAPAIEGILVSYGQDRGPQSPRRPRGFNFAKNRPRESEQKEKLRLIVTVQFYQPANCSQVFRFIDQLVARFRFLNPAAGQLWESVKIETLDQTQAWGSGTHIGSQSCYNSCESDNV